MSTRRKEQVDHLKNLLRLRRYFDYYSKTSTEFFTGKLQLITAKGSLLFNKKELEKHIQYTKKNLNI